jgi:RNA polymerase sigma factor (sigma-70 family)
MKLRNRRGSDEFLEATLPAIDLVYNLSRRFVADPLDAEDLVQETYARAFDAWQKGRRPRNVEAWIATICLNAGRSWVRRASRRREVPTEMDPSLPDPADVEEVLFGPDGGADGLAQGRNAIHAAIGPAGKVDRAGSFDYLPRNRRAMRRVFVFGPKRAFRKFRAGP